jgi:hypothetical protein
MYLKTVTHMMFDVEASLLAARHTDILTSAEGMDGHRYSAVIRLENLKPQ